MAFSEFNYEEYIEQLKKDYYEDGLEEGWRDAMRAAAERLKAEGLDTEKIVQITGLDKETIEKL